MLEFRVTVFADRTAFLLNAAAKNVTDRLMERLVNVVPSGDLFYSKSLDDAARYADTIVERGYRNVFTGGGDGTVVSTVTLLRQAAARQGAQRLPAMGVLKLGTGNAMASALGASRPMRDVAQILRGAPMTSTTVDMVECEDGTLTPFAGLGYDGEVLNDYMDLKKRFTGPLGKRVMQTVGGYLVATVGKSLPRMLMKRSPVVRITSKRDAIKKVWNGSTDVDHVIPAGTVLFEGSANVVSVGTIPYYGYKFTMFPFAAQQQGKMQLRVVQAGALRILANLYPKVWNGSFRNNQLMHDFLLEDVTIESNDTFAYQVGGDGAGRRSKLSFRVAREPVRAVRLGRQLTAGAPSSVALLPPAQA